MLGATSPAWGGPIRAETEGKVLAAHRVQGIFAIELDFEADLRHPSPTQSMFESMCRATPQPTPFIFRACRSRDEMFVLLKLWATRYRHRYPILSVGGHGAPGVVSVGDRRAGVDAVALEEIIDAIAGRATGAWLHVASCEALALHGNRLNALRQRAGLAGVSGFQQAVEFVDAMALETLLFDKLSHTRLNARGRRAIVRYANTLRVRRGPFAHLGLVVSTSR